MKNLKKILNRLNILAQVDPIAIGCGCEPNYKWSDMWEKDCVKPRLWNGEMVTFVWKEKYDASGCQPERGCLGQKQCKFTGTCKHPNHPLPGGGGSYVRRMITGCTNDFKPRIT